MKSKRPKCYPWAVQIIPAAPEWGAIFFNERDVRADSQAEPCVRFEVVCWVLHEWDPEEQDEEENRTRYRSIEGMVLPTFGYPLGEDDSDFFLSESVLPVSDVNCPAQPFMGYLPPGQTIQARFGEQIRRRVARIKESHSG